MKEIPEKMDEKQFQILSRKMDMIIKLLALNAVKGKEIKEQIWLLSSTGLQPKDIAGMLGKTSDYVRVSLHRLRSEMKKQEAEASTKEGAKPQEGET